MLQHIQSKSYIWITCDVRLALIGLQEVPVAAIEAIKVVIVIVVLQEGELDPFSKYSVLILSVAWMQACPPSQNGSSYGILA